MEDQSVWGETPLWFIAALVTWKQFSFFFKFEKHQILHQILWTCLFCLLWFAYNGFVDSLFHLFKCFGFLVRSSHLYYSSWLFSSSNFTLFLHFFLIIICHWPDVPFVGGLVDVVKKVPKTADDPRACSTNGFEFKALHFTTGVCLGHFSESSGWTEMFTWRRLRIKSANLRFFSAWSWIISPLWIELGGLGCVLLCAPWLRRGRPKEEEGTWKVEKTWSTLLQPYCGIVGEV